MSPVQLASHVVRSAATTIRQRLVALKPPYGNDARQALEADLPIGTEISLRTKASDRYGRTVAEVLKGTININQALVAAGAAFVYWQYIEGCDRETYSRLENEARLKSLGIWAVPGGIQ